MSASLRPSTQTAGCRSHSTTSARSQSCSSSCRWRRGIRGGAAGGVVGQESVRQEARRLALDVLVRRRERAKRERRLNGLAVERLTALGERDSAMRDTRAACRRGAPSDPLSRQLVHATSSGQAGGDSQPSSFNNRSISTSAAANDASLCAA